MGPPYQPSGKFGAPAVATVVVGAALCVVLAWAYQTAVNWMPLVYVTFLLTAGFGAVVGTIAAYALRRGRSRSETGNAASVVGLVAVFWASSFVFDFEHVEAIRSQGSLSIFEGPLTPDLDAPSPATFADYVEFKTSRGWNVGRTGTIGRVRIEGPGVYVIWLGEATLLGAAAWRRAKPRATPPFCEPCGIWPERRELPFVVGVASEELEHAVTRRDLRALVTPSTYIERPVTAEYTLIECPRCRRSVWLDVSAIVDRSGGSGRVKMASRPIARSLALSPSERDLVVAAREPKRRDAPASTR